MKGGSNLFLFRSDTSEALHGFAPTSAGENLPAKLGPWTNIGVVRPDQSPPHGLRRTEIEKGIAKVGYQMWRKKAKA
ncbi:hypothetical protein BH10PSE7_BH10PSE7_10970 [soil metagenome]